ncbi:MAG: hypothetical protein AB7U92_01855 [Piscinibacter sp.]|uniref:hypothetical protein n=1 Tax=Piscinibacter sp. TaxID=1903157 RepID=UPI003D12CCDC
MSEPRDDNADLPRDAWLREALRHAPDADAAPPPKLNETILRMGRAAVAPREERKPAAVHHAAPSLPSGTVAGGGALASLWAWLMRPPVAAGFAVVFLSTVVGVMWMGRPIEEALPPREETVAAAPPATTAADVPLERAREAPGLPEAAKRAAEPAAPAPPPPEPPKARKPEAPAVQAAPPAPAAAPAAANDMAARELASAERREAPAARMAAAAPAPAQATAPAPAASGIETPSLSNLRFEIRRKPETWTWQRDDGEPRPMDDAMQEWIAQADRTARPSWQYGKGSGGAVTTTLRFTRDGVVRAILRIGPAGMQLTRGGKDESVELSRGQLAALQSSLDALGP